MSRVPVAQTSGKAGKTVEVAGWVNARRAHGELVFIDLRDESGVLQVVANKKDARDLRPEWVLRVMGKIKKRPENMRNPNLATGDVELTAEHITVLAKAKTPPFPLDTDGYDIDEAHRLKHRYLDLRRPRLQRNLRLRSQIVHRMRSFLHEKGFVEIETPLLTKSTPEGARDFLVPSRIGPGLFYALPQSPQQYKQLLQAAGFSKYFQVAKGIRDEDPRGDRQAEFTQLDIEMSFVEQEDILSLVEELYTKLAEEFFPGRPVQKTPFPRIPYKEAMEKYGTDKPDLRKKKEELAFAFVVDFPAFEYKEQEKRWDAVHHPFTLPKTTDIEEIRRDPGSVLAHQYDFVLNGEEIGGGSLRISDSKFLGQIFELMGNGKKEVQDKFGHLLDAFEYGVPPHGGIAPGIDRFCAAALGEPNIREVIAFPKTGDNRDLMMGAPSEVSEEQLRELGLKVVKKKA